MLHARRVLARGEPTRSEARLKEAHEGAGLEKRVCFHKLGIRSDLKVPLVFETKRKLKKRKKLILVTHLQS
jgi:hypothetical protein